jgi:heme oxygenase
LRVRERSLHARLKQATAELHEKVESAFQLQRPLNDRASYSHALAKLRNVHACIEGCLKEIDWTDASIEISARMKKSAWIDSDLETLGHPRPPPTVQPRALISSSLGAGLGALYVIEGATLGGRVIYSRANRELSVDPENGGRFFYGYGPTTLEMWSRFLHALNGFEADSTIGDEAAESATQTFRLFVQELSA